jgi:hypothetical protein
VYYHNVLYDFIRKVVRQVVSVVLVFIISSCLGTIVISLFLGISFFG